MDFFCLSIFFKETDFKVQYYKNVQNVFWKPIMGRAHTMGNDAFVRSSSNSLVPSLQPSCEVWLVNKFWPTCQVQWHDNYILYVYPMLHPTLHSTLTPPVIMHLFLQRWAGSFLRRGKRGMSHCRSSLPPPASSPIPIYHHLPIAKTLNVISKMYILMLISCVPPQWMVQQCPAWADDPIFHCPGS